MSVGDLSVIEQCEDTEAPKVVFNFVTIDKLEQRLNKNCDVVGIVTDVGSKTEIQLKSGKGSKPKRNVTLVDQSGKQVALTLWDTLADEIVEENATNKDVVAIRAMRVSEYNGCSLNTTRSSVIQINPDLSEVTKLKVTYLSCVPRCLMCEGAWCDSVWWMSLMVLSDGRNGTRLMAPRFPSRRSPQPAGAVEAAWLRESLSPSSRKTASGMTRRPITSSCDATFPSPQRVWNRMRRQARSGPGKAFRCAAMCSVSDGTWWPCDGPCCRANSSHRARVCSCVCPISCPW
jgi:hypothetical protein